MIDIIGNIRFSRNRCLIKQSLSTPNSVGGGIYVLFSLNLHAVAIGKKLQTNQKLETLVWRQTQTKTWK